MTTDFIMIWLFILTYMVLARSNGPTPEQTRWLREQMEKEGRERYE